MSCNCEDILNQELCDIPYEWRSQIVKSICTFQEHDYDCDKSCQTITFLSQFRNENNQICISYLDEKGKKIDTCFDYDLTETILNDLFVPDCVPLPTGLSFKNLTLTQKFQHIIDLLCKSCCGIPIIPPNCNPGTITGGLITTTTTSTSTTTTRTSTTTSTTVAPTTTSTTSTTSTSSTTTTTTVCCAPTITSINQNLSTGVVTIDYTLDNSPQCIACSSVVILDYSLDNGNTWNLLTTQPCTENPKRFARSAQSQGTQYRVKLGIQGCPPSNVVTLTTSFTPTTTIPPCAGNCAPNAGWTYINATHTTFANGDPIQYEPNAGNWTIQFGWGGYGPKWCYWNNDPSTEALWGKCYNWAAINDPRGFAPPGYRVPTAADAQALVNCLGGNANYAGYKMKSTTGWNPSSTPFAGNGDNSSCLDIKATGMRSSSTGQFVNQGQYTQIWLLGDSGGVMGGHVMTLYDFSSGVAICSGATCINKSWGCAARLIKI